MDVALSICFSCRTNRSSSRLGVKTLKREVQSVIASFGLLAKTWMALLQVLALYKRPCRLTIAGTLDAVAKMLKYEGILSFYKVCPHS
jgi:hypothetical protein